MATEPKKRKPNFTKEEMNVLLEEVEGSKDVLFSRLTNVLTNKKKQDRWSLIVNKINAVAPNATSRTLKEIKKKWEDAKAASKKRAVQLKKEQKQTGGGSKTPDLTNVDQKVLNIIGADSIDGVADGMESGVSIVPSAGSQDISLSCDETLSSDEDISEGDMSRESVSLDENRPHEAMPMQSETRGETSASSFSTEVGNGVGQGKSTRVAFSGRVNKNQGKQARILQSSESSGVEQLIEIHRKQLEVETQRLALEKERLQIERERLQLEKERAQNMHYCPSDCSAEIPCRNVPVCSSHVIGGDVSNTSSSGVNSCETRQSLYTLHSTPEDIRTPLRLENSDAGLYSA